MDAESTRNYDDRRNQESVGGGLESIDIQHYLRILRKYKVPIVLFTAVLTALAAYYAFTATPVYRATATLLIEQQQIGVPTLEELYGVPQNDSDYYQTQFELLKSRNLAQSVVDRLDLWSHPALGFVSSDASRSQEEGGTAGPVQRVTDWIAQYLPEDRQSGDASETTVDGSVPVVEAPVVDDTRESDNPFDPAVLPPGVSPEEAAFAALEGADGFLDRSPALEPDQERVVNAFMSRLDVAPLRKTKLVNISFESEDPVLAARVANTVGDEYIKSHLQKQLERTSMASGFLREQLVKLEADRDEVESRLIAFKEENGLVDVEGSVGRLNEQEILLLTTELTQARSQLAAAESVSREVQRLSSQPELLESIPAVQADPLVQRAKIDQGGVQRELDELLGRYGERHPNVVDKQSELASINATLQGHVNRVVASIAQDAELARQRVAEIEAKRASGRAEIASIGTKSFELESLQREAEAKRDIYNQFFNRLTEARSAEGLEAANARISDFARPPVEPAKPNKQLIIAVAALGALILSMLMAFLYETMDDTVKGTNDVESKLGVPLLGILPLIKTGLFKSKRDLPLEPTALVDKRGTFAESVNTARTALSLGDHSGHRKIIVVTSSVPGEGKSTASINLANSFGQLERVLLIDCDLRRPTIAKAAGLTRDVPGLSSMIAGTTQARQCIQTGMFGGAVDILPAGPLPDQPLEFLSSKRFELILAGLSKHYDRILIDSAPTQAVSDALVLGRYADAVVYVIKSHDTSIELVRRGLHRLKEAGAKVAGVLMTQVDIDRLASYGGDYYYQGYYDYYGYTEKQGPREKGSGRIRLTSEELSAIRRDDDDFDLGLGSPELDANGTVEIDAALESGEDNQTRTRRRPASRKFEEGDLEIL